MNPRPAVYETAALPLSYAGVSDKKWCRGVDDCNISIWDDLRAMTRVKKYQLGPLIAGDKGGGYYTGTNH